MAICTALKRNGDPCRGSSVPGAFVCKFHGGNTWQVRKNAAEALEWARDEMIQLIEPAIEQLKNIIENEDIPHHVRIKAVDSLLDRVGLSPVKKTENTTPIDEEVKRLVQELRARG